jgi:hypothetical protein
MSERAVLVTFATGYVGGFFRDGLHRGFLIPVRFSRLIKKLAPGFETPFTYMGG